MFHHETQPDVTTSLKNNLAKYNKVEVTLFTTQHVTVKCN